MCAYDRLNVHVERRAIKLLLLAALGHRTFGLFLINDRITIATKAQSMFSSRVACDFDFCIFSNAIFFGSSLRLMFCLGVIVVYCQNVLEMEITKIFYLLTENKSADKCVYIKNDLVQKKIWVETGMVVVDFG